MTERLDARELVEQGVSDMMAIWWQGCAIWQCAMRWSRVCSMTLFDYVFLSWMVALR